MSVFVIEERGTGCLNCWTQMLGWPMDVLAPAIFDLVDHIAAASTVDAVWDAYLGAAGKVGLNYGVACFMPPTPDNSVQIISDALPENWLVEYYEQGLDVGDLLAERAKIAARSFEWKIDDWDTGAMSPVQQRWHDHNLERGIHGGLAVISFQPGANMLLVICGRDGSLSRHDRLTLYFAGQEAMLRMRDMVFPDYAPLSRRESECLRWAAAGKTDWETGQILSLSEKTVNVYIERAKAKFHVSTRAQAVALAIRAGMIAA